MHPSVHLLVPALTILNWSVGAASVSANPPSLDRNVSPLHHDSGKRQFFTADYGTSSDSAPKHLYKGSHTGSTSSGTDSASTSKDPPSAERHRRRISVMNVSALDRILPTSSQADSGPPGAGRHGILGRAIDHSTIRARSSTTHMSPVGVEGRAVTTQKDTHDSPVELHRQPEKGEVEGGAKHMPTRFARDPLLLDSAKRRFARDLMKPMPAAVHTPPEVEASPSKPEASLPQSNSPENATPEAAEVSPGQPPSVRFEGRQSMRQWIRRNVDAE